MKSFIFILIIISSSQFVYPQVFREFNTGFKTVLINPAEVNSYYFGGNPALLNFGQQDELLILGSDVNMDEGKFKRFIDPASNRFYQLTASGKKAIDSSQRFQGSFGFQRNERRDWAWIFTRDYQTGNPFLIGDSTVGASSINGINVNADYAINLFQNISAGIHIDYSVDEMLKEVSPRPTSSHRDIHSSLGLNYSFSQNFNLGLIASLTDKNEEISYREDEGAITQETIILKFKGYDFPNVFKKKTETRYSYSNIYSAGLTASYSEDQITACSYFAGGFEKSMIKDDAIDPSAEGFWRNNFVDAGLQLTASINQDIRAGLIYNLHQNDGWAKYPPYNVLYSENEMDMHYFTAGVQYAVSEKINLGLEGGVKLVSSDYHDYYSGISQNVKSSITYIRTGFGADWSEDISSIISYAFSHNSSPDKNLEAEAQSKYFSSYRIYDLMYLAAAFNQHDFSASLKLVPWFGGSFYVNLNYSTAIPKDDNYFKNEVKNTFLSRVEYRVKVF